MADYRRRKICFRCDGPFSADHVCGNPRLNVMLLGIDGDDEQGGEEMGNPGMGVEEPHMRLSVHSIIGVTSNRSFKVWGELLGRRIVVLVDTGATHNFFREQLAKDLGVPIDTKQSHTIEVGDGHCIQSGGVCRQLLFTFPGLVVIQDFYLFPLTGVDAILGFEWLEGLGEIRANFRELSLKVPKRGWLS